MKRTMIVFAAVTVWTATALLGAGGADAQDRPNVFKDAKSWAFQLKNLGAEEQAKIAASPFDLVVIDSAKFEGDREVPLTREEVERMKKKPDGSRRIVISYFSVGEAENYRSYWRPEWNKNKPSWVGKENKEWKENFLVKYWEPTWQNIVFGNPQSFADRVINSGFDGFYVDRADAYYYYGDTPDMRKRMKDFIIKLTNYMRSKKPDVGILVQNAEELLDDPAYVQAIDGIAKEDLLYGITHKEEPNKKSDVDWSGKLLKDAQAKGKKIFVIEYLSKPNYIEDAGKRLAEMGFVMYTGPRGLAALQAQGPRRGPLDPTPANPSANETLTQKATNKAKDLGARAKEKAQAVGEKAKALLKKQPAQ
jgi:cysteinyl-tRNA synthetase, unknown class